MLCLAKVSAIHTIVQLLLCAVTFDRIDWPNGLGEFRHPVEGFRISSPECSGLPQDIHLIGRGLIHGH